MNKKVKIEINAETAELLEARALARGMSISELLVDLAGDDNALPTRLETMRAAGDGPWAPELLAEDARRLAEFHRTREALPWYEVRVWMQSWGTPHEMPAPRPRKV